MSHAQQAPGPAGEAPASAPAGCPAPDKPARDRYFDLLRALALARVVVYHATGWSWLAVLFPSMGVMFALAGALMARSLTSRDGRDGRNGRDGGRAGRRDRPAVHVVRGRLRRLLPPFWLLGAVGLTGMLAGGWGPDAEGHPGWWWTHLLFWVLPLSDPPFAERVPGVDGFLADDWAAELAGPLWYLRAYLWFVLLSPLLLRALRRLPWPTVLAPLALCAALDHGLLDLPGERFPSALTDFGVFGACWLLGMAHQEGVLQRLPPYLIPSLAPLVIALGLWLAASEGFGSGRELDELPLANAVHCFGAVLLLLHLSPSWPSWPRALRRWARPIALLNARAVTIYLWHNICVLAAATLWNRLWGVPVLEQHAPWLLASPVPVVLLACALVAGCVLCLGRVEDIAARRGPRLRR